MTSLKMWQSVAVLAVLGATMVSSSLITEDAQPCLFAGNSYNHGQMIQDVCVLMICVDGVWSSEWILTESRCRCCEVFGDPHFHTFDRFDYNFQGSCNYTIAQTGGRANPPTGVFGQFEECAGKASCLDTTTYKENANTIITLTTRDHTTVKVNGVNQLLTSAVQALGDSVLASANTTCSIMLGASKFVIKQCKNYMAVCAPLPRPGEVKVEGLCGHFDNHVKNDFTDRGGLEHKLTHSPRFFPASWKAPDQRNLQCHKHLQRIVIVQETDWNTCNISSEEIDELRAKCHSALSQEEDVSETLFQAHLGACVEDLCMKLQNDAPESDLDAWLVEAQCTLRLSAGTHNKDLGVQC